MTDSLDALRLRQMWSAVVLCALRDFQDQMLSGKTPAIRDGAVPAARRYFNSADGRQVLESAGFTSSPAAVELLVAEVSNQHHRSACIHRNAHKRRVNANEAAHG